MGKRKRRKKETPAMLCFALCFPPIGYPVCLLVLLALMRLEALSHLGLLMSDMAARIVLVMRLFVGVFEVAIG